MKKILLAVMMAASLTACHDDRPQYDSNAGVQPPVAVVQAPSGNGGVLTGALLGGAAGFMAGKLSNRSTAAAPTPVTQVTNITQTVVKKVYVQAPKAAGTPATSKLSLAKTISPSFSKRK